jgi:hypothetical protein
MSKRLPGQRSLWTSYAEDFPVKTCQAQARELALKVLEAAFGMSSLELLKRSVRHGLSSKTSQAVRADGSIRCADNWGTLAMRHFRSRLARIISEHPISDDATLSLPTLTAVDYGSNQGGRTAGAGRVRHSVQTLARAGALPTLTTGRNLISPHMEKWPAHKRLATLIARDANTIKKLTRGKRSKKKNDSRTSPISDSLVLQIGETLSPQWCEWYQGFPIGWTELER